MNGNEPPHPNPFQFPVRLMEPLGCDEKPGTDVASESGLVVQKFQASLAHYASNQGPAITPRRSPRQHVPRKVDDDTTPTRKMDKLQKRPVESDGDSSHPKRSTEPSPKKRKRGYADPGVYAHLHELQDHLKEELDVMFCGINPGQKSAEIGHHFGNPSNHFWHCLHESGFTPEKLKPEEDFTLPERFSLGLTDLVDRPTAEQSELSAVEQVGGVQLFLAKVARYRPRIVCFVGLGISKIVRTELFSRKDRKSNDSNHIIGLQPYKLTFPETTEALTVRETLFYAVPSTSGRVVQFQRTDKVKIFADLKNQVEEIKLGKLDTTDFTSITSPNASVKAAV